MRFRYAVLILGIISSSALAQRVAPLEPTTTPPTIAPSPVTESYFGTKVTDPYRGLESLDVEALAWMRRNGEYTRSVIESVPARADNLAKLSQLTGAFGTVEDVQFGGDRLFYLGRAPERDQADLMIREPDGSQRSLLDMTAYIADHGGTLHAIDYYAPSHDGTRVAVGISSGGSENSALSIIDTETGKTLAGPVERAQFRNVAWLHDSRGLFFSRRQDNDDENQRFLNSTVVFWDFKSEPRIIVGAAEKLGPNLDESRFPGVRTVAGSDQLILVVANGAQPELELWVTPIVDAISGGATWRKIARQTDAITDFSADNDRIVLLGHAGAPTFKVTVMSWSETASTAKTLLAGSPDRINESVGIAREGIYVGGREGLNARPLFFGASGQVRQISLPFDGTMGRIVTDAGHTGAVFNLQSNTRPPTTYSINNLNLTELRLETRPSLDYTKYLGTETVAVARDGAKVPMTILTAAGSRVARPTLLNAFGAYGASLLPEFSAYKLAFVEAGGTVVECSVRGGGELGESWRLGGKDGKKPNSWRDAIACAETAIKLGYTTKEQLAITGTSAGGIVVGRAATERPDLFAAAISRVGDLNARRLETMASGPANIPEFGTVKDRKGFESLYAMDAYQHINKGAVCPAWLLTTGLNDPRVAPWQTAKMAARLQTSSNQALALIRIEEDAGHGGGTARSTLDAEEADIATFIFWRAGDRKWQPVFPRIGKGD